MKDIINKIKESVVFLGFVNNGQPKVTGTGFLIKVGNFFHLVTAKHVAENNHENLCAFFNSKQFNRTIVKPLKKIYQDNLSWIEHKDKNVDIAILPFSKGRNNKVDFIPQELMINDLSELSELTDVFYLSYQPGLHDLSKDKNVNPIIRKGTISKLNDDDTFFIDGFAFPGNSGSPVFQFPTPFHISNEGLVIGGPTTIKLVGVMGAYITYRDVAISQQTKKPKVIFEENTGLSLVHPSKFINDIITSDQFQKQSFYLQQRQQVLSGKNITPSTQTGANSPAPNPTNNGINVK